MPYVSLLDLTNPIHFVYFLTQLISSLFIDSVYFLVYYLIWINSFKSFDLTWHHMTSTIPPHGWWQKKLPIYIL